MYNSLGMAGSFLGMSVGLCLSRMIVIPQRCRKHREPRVESLQLHDSLNLPEYFIRSSTGTAPSASLLCKEIFSMGRRCQPAYHRVVVPTHTQSGMPATSSRGCCAGGASIVLKRRTRRLELLTTQCRMLHRSGTRHREHLHPRQTETSSLPLARK